MTESYRPLFSKLPPSRIERWHLVKTFAARWHQPFAQADGASESEITQAEHELGIRIPTALREWHLLAGKKTKIWSHQDHLVKLTELEFSRADDALLFRYENQACERWGIRREDITLDDPPVWSFVEKREESP